MEYWDYTDNMNAKEGYIEPSKMNISLVSIENNVYSIIYNDSAVGTITIQAIKDTIAEISIIVDDSYRNKGIGTKAIGLACSIVKDELGLAKLKAKILKEDSRSQLVFFKNHFDLAYSQDEYLIFEKKLNS